METPLQNDIARILTQCMQHPNLEIMTEINKILDVYTRSAAVYIATTRIIAEGVIKCNIKGTEINVIDYCGGTMFEILSDMLRCMLYDSVRTDNVADMLANGIVLQDNNNDLNTMSPEEQAEKIMGVIECYIVRCRPATPSELAQLSTVLMRVMMDMVNAHRNKHVNNAPCINIETLRGVLYEPSKGAEVDAPTGAVPVWMGSLSQYAKDTVNYYNQLAENLIKEHPEFKDGGRNTIEFKFDPYAIIKSCGGSKGGAQIANYNKAIVELKKADVITARVNKETGDGKRVLSGCTVTNFIKSYTLKNDIVVDGHGIAIDETNGDLQIDTIEFDINCLLNNAYIIPLSKVAPRGYNSKILGSEAGTAATWLLNRYEEGVKIPREDIINNFDFHGDNATKIMQRICKNIEDRQFRVIYDKKWIAVYSREGYAAEMITQTFAKGASVQWSSVLAKFPEFTDLSHDSILNKLEDLKGYRTKRAKNSFIFDVRKRGKNTARKRGKATNKTGENAK